MTPSKEAEAMREAIIAAITGGSTCDPQRICDMIRALPAILSGVVSIPVIKEGARLDEASQKARAVLDRVADVATPAAPASELMRKALKRIARWHGEFPATGKTWQDGTPTSYAAEYGSNGERDYMRRVALDALSATAPVVDAVSQTDQEMVSAAIATLRECRAEQFDRAIVEAIPDGWKLVPLEPTPAIIAGAAIALWPTASAADVALARKAAPLVLMQMDVEQGVTADMLAATLATMAPAYRAMLAAAPAPGEPQ